MRIAICDDDKKICKALEDDLTCIANENNFEDDISVFYEADTFIESFASYEEYDIVFLDIEIGRDSGIDVAKHIRNSIYNNDIQIVFISHNKSYAMELFDVRPLNFLIKPIDKNKVFDVYMNTKKLLEDNDIFFVYQKEKIKRREKIKDILYFESDNRKIRIITNIGKDDFYGKIADINMQLSDAKFMHIHKSFLINFHHIEAITYETVTMSNGKVLNISRSRRKSIREQYSMLEGAEQ